MLPNFKIPVEVRPGERRALLVRDVPACVFWYGFPDLSQKYAGRDFLVRMATWEEGVLYRALVRPRLTAEDIVARFGGAMRLPMRAYLEAVGFRVRVGDPPPALELDEQNEPTVPRADDVALRAWVPAGVLRQMFAATAAAAHVSPAVLWVMPISEMLFNCRVAMADEMLARVEAVVAAPPPTRPRGTVVPLRPKTFDPFDTRDPMTVIGVER